MSSYDRLVIRDAPPQELAYLVELTTAELCKHPRWTRTTGTVPGSTGIRVRMGARNWGERVLLSVEEKSIRIQSESVFIPFSPFKSPNAANVERVHAMLRKAVERVAAEGLPAAERSAREPA
ncbi:MAG: hypothetical protein QGI46_06390 [Planctomycetota bacterium]|jgi:hypothetical protein|nr:hypothetical protein [Planctomycetota bacterium]